MSKVAKVKSVSQCQKMTEHMTPQQAADFAKVSRTTIMQALKSHELKGVQSNNGRWKITKEAIEDWLSLRPDTSRYSQKETETDTVSVSSELVAAQIEIAKLTAEKEGLEARLSDTQAERDRLAETLNKTLESQRRAGFFRRLFRS